MNTPLKYPGAKTVLAPWIVRHFPQHSTYVEPFCGSSAVFFCKAPSLVEYLNDLDGEIIELFRTMRDYPDELCAVLELTPYARAEYEAALEYSENPLERARRTLVKHWMSHSATADARPQKVGWRHGGTQDPRQRVPFQWASVPARIQGCLQRLRMAHLECRPASDLLERLDGPETLFYCDPPYPRATRMRAAALYREEMLSLDEHEALLEQCLNLRGMAVISGYAHPLYDGMLESWGRKTRQVACNVGTRQEMLWINPLALERLEEQQGLFGGDS